MEEWQLGLLSKDINRFEEFFNANYLVLTGFVLQLFNRTGLENFTMMTSNTKILTNNYTGKMRAFKCSLFKIR